MKVVVTGGGGFVGSHVVERYAKAGEWLKSEPLAPSTSS